MSKHKLILCSILLLTILLSPARADIRLGGYIEMDERLRTAENEDFERNRITLGLEGRMSISPNVSARAELKLKSTGLSKAEKVADLSDRSMVDPLKLELYEAYMDVYGFVFDNVDLRVGKQRIAWGSADKLNPTDVINPYDFSDVLKFGEKSPSNSINLTAYFDETQLTTVYVPVFVPSILPDFYEEMYTKDMTEMAASAGIDLTIENRIFSPAATLKNSMSGLRIKRDVAGIDASLSYFEGFDSVPNIEYGELTGADISTLEINTLSTYPKIKVVGADLAGDFNGIGFWLEAANYQPQNTTQNLWLAIGSTTLEGHQKIRDYTKYTFGCDYKFANGLYVNAQFMHGFFDERGAEITDVISDMLVKEGFDPLPSPKARLSDMIFIKVEQKVLDDKFNLACTWGTHHDFDRQKQVIGYVLNPEITYFAAEATEITLGNFVVDGDKYTKYGMMKDLDFAYLKFKYSF